MATIIGDNGGTVLTGTEADDVIYGYSLAVGQITATSVAGGFDAPVFATSAPGDPGRLYVVEKDLGQIIILDPQTGARSTFLTIPSNQLTTGGEQGLLSLAFHPDYQTNGRFFVNLVNANGDVEVRSYTRSTGNANLADPGSASTVIIVPHPVETNHNGGTVAFGPDGYLYVSIGDGGGGGDPGENAQNIDSLLGKMLRLDVNSDAFPGDSARNYAIPASNPFVGIAGADEIWAYGLRNPWRFSFDAATGDLYIGDVGQSTREEVDVQTGGSPGGLNFGWDNKEGTFPFEGPLVPGLVDPIYDYGRDLGGAVTGGYVYHGAAPQLQGAYVFADFLSSRIWALRVVDGQVVVAVDELTDQIVTGGAPLSQIASFGVDGNGGLYVVSLAGEIYRLEPSVAATDGNDTVFAGGGNDTIAGGLGNDVIDGGTGSDTVVFGKTFGSYTALAYAGTIAVLTNATAEHDRATNVEHLQFADLTINANAVTAFDAFEYLASYGDLITAFGANGQSGFDHYVNFGFAEGRARDAFDNFDYLASWGDLVAALGPNPQAAAQHYVTWGFNEGRARDTFANFDYLASYGDLIVAFGPNPQAAAEHYVTWGFNEGRTRDGFDNFQYIASWGDLIMALGPNAQAAAQHYVTWGFNEGRARDSFNAEQYLANYGDLQTAFGTDVNAATIHFIRYGFFEGRTDHPI